MAGILDGTNQLFNAGMGILSANQRSPVYRNPVDSMQKGLMQGQLLKRQQQQDMMKQQEYDMKMKEYQAQQVAAQQEQAQLEQFVMSFPPELRDKVRMNPKEFAQPEATAKTPADIQKYQMAVQQGFKGTLKDWEIEMANAKRPSMTSTVNLPATKDFLKTSDLKNYRRWNENSGAWEYPKGIDTPENILSKGFEYTSDSVIGEEKDNTKLLNEKTAVIENMKNSISQYRGTLEQTGTKLLPSDEKMLLESDYTNMQMNAKNYLELGVLAGPDLDLMTKIAADPTSVISNFLTRDGDLSGLMNQLDSIERGLDSTQNVYNSIYKVKTPKTKSGLSSTEMGELEELRKLKESGDI